MSQDPVTFVSSLQYSAIDPASVTNPADFSNGALTTLSASITSVISSMFLSSKSLMSSLNIICSDSSGAISIAKGASSSDCSVTHHDNSPSLAFQLSSTIFVQLVSLLCRRRYFVVRVVSNSCWFFSFRMSAKLKIDPDHSYNLRSFTFQWKYVVEYLPIST